MGRKKEKKNVDKIVVYRTYVWLDINCFKFNCVPSISVIYPHQLTHLRSGFCSCTHRQRMMYIQQVKLAISVTVARCIEHPSGQKYLHVVRSPIHSRHVRACVHIDPRTYFLLIISSFLSYSVSNVLHKLSKITFFLLFLHIRTQLVYLQACMYTPCVLQSVVCVLLLLPWH